jgi:hypothetical protein
MKTNETRRQVSEAIAACQEKKAEEITILELEKDSGAFTDYFVVCSGTNPRQIQAIADEVELRLKSGFCLTMWTSWSTFSPRRRADTTNSSVSGNRPSAWSPLI